MNPASTVNCAQTEAWARTTAERAYELRRKIATIALGLLSVWLLMHVMFSQNGIVVYQKKKAEYRNLQKDIDSLQRQNQAITGQNQALERNDPKAIEKEAREQLRYARPGEVVYVMPEPVQPPANAAVVAPQKP